MKIKTFRQLRDFVDSNILGMFYTDEEQGDGLKLFEDQVNIIIKGLPMFTIVFKEDHVDIYIPNRNKPYIRDYNVMIESVTGEEVLMRTVDKCEL